MRPFERFRLEHVRRRLLSSLDGPILELGCGTGANFPYYPSPERVVAVEPDPDMRRMAEGRKPPGLTILAASAEKFEWEGEPFANVVSTLVLCSVDDLPRVLERVRRVLRPDGRFLFLEHVRGEGAVGRLHDFCTPLWSKIAGGCRLNRRTLEELTRGDFTVTSTTTVLRFLGTPFILGEAKVASSRGS